MEATPENRTTLRHGSAFAQLSDPDCDALLLVMREKRLAPHEVLFRQGQSGDSMVIVQSGSLAVRARRPDGYDAEVARIGPGEVLGELCCVDPAPRSASVVALGESRVCELHAAALARLRDVAPGAYAAVMAAIIRDISRRTREVDAKAAELVAAKPASQPPRSPSSPAPAVPSQPPTHLSWRAPKRTSFPSPPTEDAPAEAPEAPTEPNAVRRFLDRLRGLA